MRRPLNKLLKIEIPDNQPDCSVPVPQNLPMVELTRSLWISSHRAAKDLSLLRAFGITHILNLASIRHCPNLYLDEFTYCSVPLPDSPSVDLALYLPEAIEFISSAVQEGGKVLVHCLRGKSRAPTVACAYLVAMEMFSTDRALKVLKQKQPLADPNFGFISQLAVLREGSEQV